MKYLNPKVFKLASKCLRLQGKHLHHDEKSPYSCVAIGYACDELKASKYHHQQLFESYFKDMESEYYNYYGWFDKSEPKQALKERKIALELMYHICKEL